MRILVLDGSQNQAVAAIRSLARAGHTVLAGDSRGWSKAGWSRACTAMFQYPGPQSNAEAFVNRIAEIACAEPGTLVLPMTEATTLPLSAHRDVLSRSGARFVFPAHTDLLRAFDKSQTTALANSLGVAVPKTMAVIKAEQTSEVLEHLKFPLVLKPRASEELSESGKVRTTGRPLYASTPQEFRERYEEIRRRCSAVIVQEYIRGECAGYFALMNHGKLRAEFAHRRIRDVYPTGSGSALRISVDPRPEIREPALKILQALNWHGVAMVEFRERPGSPPVFLEVNGRFWNSLALACYAGVDFPSLVAQLAERGDVAAPRAYRVGVRCRWLLGDFRHLIEVWKGPPPGFPEPYPGRLDTLLAELTPVPGTRHDLFSGSDPMPEVGDWLSFAQKIWERIAN